MFNEITFPKMPKVKEVTSFPDYGGTHYYFTFMNGRGASVIKNKISYGGAQGLWELAVLDRNGNLDYSTEITDDVIGSITEEEVYALLMRIGDLSEGKYETY